MDLNDYINNYLNMHDILKIFSKHFHNYYLTDLSNNLVR